MSRTVHSPEGISAGSPARPSDSATRREPIPDPCRPERHAFYLPIRIKFALALVLAAAWTILSIWLSLRWLNDLVAVAGLAFALIAIGFIAWVPGFVNAFLIATLLLDRKPRLRAYPTR